MVWYTGAVSLGLTPTPPLGTGAGAAATAAMPASATREDSIVNGLSGGFEKRGGEGRRDDH